MAIKDDVYDQINQNIQHAITHLNEAASSQFNGQAALVNDVTDALNKLYEHIKDEYAHGVGDPNSYLRRLVTDVSTDVATNTSKKITNETIEEVLPNEINKQLPVAIDTLLPPAVDKEVTEVVNTKVPEKISEVLPGEVEKQTTSEINKQLPQAVETEVTNVVSTKVPEAIQNTLPAEVEKQTQSEISKQLPAAVNNQVSTVVNQKVPEAINTQLPGAINQQVPNAVIQQLPGILEQELNKEDSTLKEVFTEKVTTIVQEKIDEGEITGGIGGAGGIVLITQPVITHPDLLIIGAANSCSVTAKSKLEGSYVESFTISAGGRSWDVTAKNNVASFSVTVPTGTASGSAYAISAVAKDNLGSYSEMTTVFPKTSTASVKQPSLVSPAANALVGLSSCEMVVSDFTSVGSADTQSAVQFQALNSAGTAVYDSGEITDSTKFKSNTLKLPSTTAANTALNLRVRQKGKTLGWSAWSNNVAVKTTKDYAVIVGYGGQVISSADGIKFEKPVVEEEISDTFYINEIIGDVNGKVFGQAYLKKVGNAFSGTYVTTDGLKWTKTNLNLGSANVVVRKYGTGFMAYKDTNIYKSTDGITWTSLGAVSVPTGYTFHDLTYIDSTNTYVGLFKYNNQTVARYSVGNLLSFTNNLVNGNTQATYQAYGYIYQYQSGRVAIVSFPSYGQSRSIIVVYITTDGKTFIKVEVPYTGDEDYMTLPNVTYTNSILRYRTCNNALIFGRSDYYKDKCFFYFYVLRDGATTTPAQICVWSQQNYHLTVDTKYTLHVAYDSTTGAYAIMTPSTEYINRIVYNNSIRAFLLASNNSFTTAYTTNWPYKTYSGSYANYSSVTNRYFNMIYGIKGRFIATIGACTFNLGTGITAAKLAPPLTFRNRLKDGTTNIQTTNYYNFVLKEGYRCWITPYNKTSASTADPYYYAYTDDGTNFTSGKITDNTTVLNYAYNIYNFSNLINVGMYKAFSQYVWNNYNRQVVISNQPVSGGALASKQAPANGYLFYTGKYLLSLAVYPQISYNKTQYIYYQSSLSANWGTITVNGFSIACDCIASNGNGTIMIGRFSSGSTTTSGYGGYYTSTNHGLSWSAAIYWANKLDTNTYDTMYVLNFFYAAGYWGAFVKLKSYSTFNMILSTDLNNWSIVDLYNYSPNSSINWRHKPMVTSDKRLAITNNTGTTLYVINPSTRAINSSIIPGATLNVGNISTYS